MLMKKKMKIFIVLFECIVLIDFIIVYLIN